VDLNAIVRRLSLKPAGSRLLLLTDFDGTLVELEKDPDAVELSPARRDVLQSLACRPGVTLGVVSGRRLADLRVRVGAGDVSYYAGLHGLEIEGPGIQFLHSQAGDTHRLIQRLGRLLIDATKDLAGVRVENKELTLAMHVRGAAATAQRHAEAAFREIAEPSLETGTLRLMHGDAVFELLPGVAWTKGDAVLRIKTEVERHYGQPTCLLYVGDDVTDEDAFRAVGPEEMTIAVGHRPAPAAFRLENPDAVWRFLQQLALTGP